MGKENGVKMNCIFKFAIDGEVYHAKMVDNPLVEKIAALCPFEAEYERYKEHELELGDVVEDVVSQLKNAGKTVFIRCEVEE